MTSIRLNPLDSAWLFTESRAAPNHVGGLLQFKLPEGAPRMSTGPTVFSF